MAEAKLQPLLKLCLELDQEKTCFVPSNLFLSLISNMQLDLPLTSDTMKFIENDKINYAKAIQVLRHKYCRKDTELINQLVSMQRLPRKQRDQQLLQEVKHAGKQIKGHFQSLKDTNHSDQDLLHQKVNKPQLKDFMYHKSWEEFPNYSKQSGLKDRQIAQIPTKKAQIRNHQQNINQRFLFRPRQQSYGSIKEPSAGDCKYSNSSCYTNQTTQKSSNLFNDPRKSAPSITDISNNFKSSLSNLSLYNSKNIDVLVQEFAENFPNYNIRRLYQAQRYLQCLPSKFYNKAIQNNLIKIFNGIGQCELITSYIVQDNQISTQKMQEFIQKFEIAGASNGRRPDAPSSSIFGPFFNKNTISVSQRDQTSTNQHLNRSNSVSSYSGQQQYNVSKEFNPGVKINSLRVLLNEQFQSPYDAFKALDVQNKGFITCQDFQNAMDRLGRRELASEFNSVTKASCFTMPDLAKYLSGQRCANNTAQHGFRSNSMLGRLQKQNLDQKSNYFDMPGLSSQNIGSGSSVGNLDSMSVIDRKLKMKLRKKLQSQTFGKKSENQDEQIKNIIYGNVTPSYQYH